MEHVEIPAGERHQPHNFEYADAVERLAAVITDSSLENSLALQLDDGSYWRLVSVAPAVWTASGLKGEQGDPGPPGTSGGIEFPFSWGDASPETITTIPSGKLIYEVQVHIQTAFDGASPQLQIGDAGQADRLMQAGQLDPTQEGSYSVSPAKVYGSDTDILLTIDPGGGATAGSGLVVIFVQN